MATLTYDGSAQDHEVVPAKSAIGKDGQPIKRVYVREAQLQYLPINTYKLWGVDFPTGEAVQVRDPALVRKALALGCFEYDGPEDWLVEPPKRARDRREMKRRLAAVVASGPKEAAPAAPAKKPGRPKKAKAEEAQAEASPEE